MPPPRRLYFCSGDFSYGVACITYMWTSTYVDLMFERLLVTGLNEESSSASCATCHLHEAPHRDTGRGHLTAPSRRYSSDISHLRARIEMPLGGLRTPLRRLTFNEPETWSSSTTWWRTLPPS